MTIEAELVRHLCATRFSDLPPAAVDSARRQVLTVFGTALAGAGAAGSDKIIAFVRQQGGREEATVIGFGDRLPAGLAGMANGAFAKALEYEDKFWMDGSHGFAVGPHVVPAALATTEHLGGTDGKTFLTAIAVATDVTIRMMAGAPTSLSTGWNATYLFSSLAATMAAAKLLNLDEDQFANAMGLAFAQSTGSIQGNYEGVLGVRMQAGFGVRNGIAAAQLARLGLTGVKHFLTGQYGVYPLIFKGEKLDLDALTRDLGRTFEGVRLGFKAYPCGAVVHPVLDAVGSILGKDGVRAEAIAAVKVFGTPRLTLMVTPKELRQNPVNHVDCEFSLPWAVAGLIVEGKLTIGHFTEDALRNPRYREMARRVETEMDEARRDVTVEITLKNGRTVRSLPVRAPKGHHDNPQTTEEMVEKYRDCVQHGPKPLPKEGMERAKDMILRLQDVDDVRQVIALFA